MHYNHFTPLNAELNPICYLLALLGAHHIFHVSGLRVKMLRGCQNKYFHQFYKFLLYHGCNIKMFLTLQVLHDPQDNFNYLLYNILIIQCTKQLLTKL